MGVDGLGPLPPTTEPMSPEIDPALMSSNPMMRTSIGMNPIPIPVQPDAGTYDLPTRGVEQPTPHSWEIPLRFLSPTGPVDSILIGLLQRQRALSLEGSPAISLIGPTSPSLKALINPEQSDAVHAVASVISNLLQRTSLKSLPEKIAAMLVIYGLVQWQILPSQETYSNLPDWFTPRASQLFTAHPVWSTLVSLRSTLFHPVTDLS
jgi:hypothetical protein